MDDPAYKRFNRISVFYLSTDKKIADAATEKMINESNSYYNVYSDNCAEAIDNTIKMFGLRGGDNPAAVLSSSGISIYIGPAAPYPVDPNSLFENTIYNNSNRLVLQISR